jgi:hypothetical protein
MTETPFHVPAARAARSFHPDTALHARIRGEYHEMPGLRLTVAQAARLFNLEMAQCARVLDTLVTSGALWTNGREFLGSNAGRRFA